MPLIQPAICIGLCVFSALCWQYCAQSKRRRLGLTIRARDWLRIGTITECTEAWVRAEGFQLAGRSYLFHWGSNARTVVMSFGSRAGIDCHRRHRNSIGTPCQCADPMNSKSMSLTQRGDSYTGNLRLHDTLGVCTLVLPYHVQILFCHFATRTLSHQNSCNNVYSFITPLWYIPILPSLNYKTQPYDIIIRIITLILLHLLHLWHNYTYYYTYIYYYTYYTYTYYISYYFCMWCTFGNYPILSVLPDKFAWFLFEYRWPRFESLDLPRLPADRSDFDVHRALLDDKVQTNCKTLHFAQSCPLLCLNNFLYVL